MEYNSFYGGRRGAPFIIAKRYTTIAEMVSAFSQGGNYSAVDYDEYVLIDPVSKNDLDNGKIYRRGYDYNNSMGGAIYIGQIVGPTGLAPHTIIDTVEHVNQKATQEGYEYRRGSGDYKLDNNSIVPGKYIEAGTGLKKYNDKITWAYCSVRDSASHESTAYIGFTFPYTVIDFTTTTKSPYTNGTYTGGSAEVTRTDDGTHPFYEQWNIGVPRGVQGHSVENITLAEATSDIADYPDKTSDISNHRKVLTYDERSYDASETGVVTKRYIGKVNEIEDIAVDGNHHLLIYYSNPAQRAAIPAAQKATYNNKNDWYDLGYIGACAGTIAGLESDPGVIAAAAIMPTYSAWLIVENDDEEEEEESI